MRVCASKVEAMKKTGDIVRDLRNHAEESEIQHVDLEVELYLQAADEIERLRSALERFLVRRIQSCQ